MGRLFTVVPPKLIHRIHLVRTTYALHFTGAVPVGCYLLALSSALVSPFPSIPRIAISPSATLFDDTKEVLFLFIGFISFFIRYHLLVFESSIFLKKLVQKVLFYDFFIAFSVLNGSRNTGKGSGGYI